MVCQKENKFYGVGDENRTHLILAYEASEFPELYSDIWRTCIEFASIYYHSPRG